MTCLSRVRACKEITWTIWRPRFEAISRRDEGAMPQRIVTEEQRRNRPKMGLPEGAGRFWAATSSLVAHVPQRVRIAPRSLFRSKIAQPNCSCYFFTGPKAMAMPRMRMRFAGSPGLSVSFVKLIRAFAPISAALILMSSMRRYSLSQG